MVLESSSPSQDASATDSAPSSDADTYSRTDLDIRDGQPSSYLLVTPKGPDAVYVDLDALPHRRDFLVPTRFRGPALEKIRVQCGLVEHFLHRPVTADEAQALAFYAAKADAWESYGTVPGIAYALAQFSRYRHVSRFPWGWKPFEGGRNGPRFSPDVFGPARGAQARLLWSVSQTFAYCFVGLFGASLLFGSYGFSVATAGRMTDPRLKNFRDGLVQQRARGGLPPAAAPKRSPDESDGPRRDETLEMARQRRGAQARVAEASRGGWRRGDAGDDDMSPTGGAFQDEFVMGNGGDTGLMDDSQLRQRESQQQRSDPRSASSGNAWGQSPTSDQSSGQEYGNARAQTPSRARPSSDQSSAVESRQQQTGSAWDRLRANAMSGQQNQASQQPSRSSQQPGSNTSRTTSRPEESFSFSQKDEDQQLARTEAQKEFDARIERERSGRDFDDGGTGGWRK